MNKVQNAFDRAADTYDQHCHAQQQAGNKLTQLVKLHHAHADRLIDFGCGTGVNTYQLAAQFDYQDFHAIDISSALLQKAEQHIKKSRIHFYQMDFDHLPDDCLAFDIIYSNMALQWSVNLPALLNKTHALLKTQGTLGFSIPLAGTFREFQSHCAMNNFPEKKIIHDLLTDCGYELLSQKTDTITFSFHDTLRALKSIKQIGANHVIQRTHKGLRTPSYLNQIKTSELTYVIGYFIARKSA